MQTSRTLQKLDIATHVNTKTDVACKNLYHLQHVTIENLQKLLTKSIKKWLGIPKNLSANLYSKSTKLRLPFSELQEEFKQQKHATWLNFKIQRTHVLVVQN